MSKEQQIDEINRTIGAVQVMKLLGISPGELTYNKARQVYGRWFVNNVKSNRLRPCRADLKAKYYDSITIYELMLADTKNAELI